MIGSIAWRLLSSFLSWDVSDVNGRGYLPPAPRTDPYVRHYRIRLLP